MKNTQLKRTETSYMDGRAKQNSHNNYNNNFNFTPKNLKMEEINNMNFGTGIPVNFDDFNSLIDYNCINPAILANKLTPLEYDYYHHSNLANHHDFELIQNSNNKIPQLYPANYFPNPNLNHTNPSILPNGNLHGNILDNYSSLNYPPQLYNIPLGPNSKIPIPTLNEDEIIYVNYKQHYRILQRREKRRKLNMMMKREDVNSGKPKYIHESRHRHAMNRQRNKGGRFVSKSELEKSSSVNGENKIVKENNEEGDDFAFSVKNKNDLGNSSNMIKFEQKYETFTDKDNLSIVNENNSDISQSKNNLQLKLKVQNIKLNLYKGEHKNH